MSNFVDWPPGILLESVGDNDGHSASGRGCGTGKTRQENVFQNASGMLLGVFNHPT